MSVDAKLFISNSFNVSDVLKVIKRIADRNEATIDQKNLLIDNYLTISFEYAGSARMIFMMVNYLKNGFRGHLLTLGSWGLSTEIFEKLANVFGGFLQPTDSDENFIGFSRPVDEGLQFLLDQSIIKGACDGNDRKQFINYLKVWDKEHKFTEKFFQK
jgi:hypothetical protein